MTAYGQCDDSGRPYTRSRNKGGGGPFEELASRWLQESFEILTLLQLFWRTRGCASSWVRGRFIPRGGAALGETRHAMDRKGVVVHTEANTDLPDSPAVALVLECFRVVRAAFSFNPFLNGPVSRV